MSDVKCIFAMNRTIQGLACDVRSCHAVIRTMMVEDVVVERSVLVCCIHVLGTLWYSGPCNNEAIIHVLDTAATRPYDA